MAWSAVFVLLWGVVHLPEGWANAQRKIIQPAITYGVTLLALLSGRLLYFGYPLPNTYYAKMSPHLIYNLQQGSLYLRDFLVANGHLWLLTLLPILWLALAKGWPFPTRLSEERARSLSVVAVVVWGLAVPVLTGGDHFYLHRFYQPLWPLLILPLLLVMDEVKRPFPPALYYAVALGLLLIFCFGAQTNWWQRQKLAAVGFEFTLQQNGRLTGHSLNAMFPGDKPTKGVMAAGGIAFAYEGEVVDVLGLNNVRVAHTPGDRYGLKNHSAFSSDIFLQQHPALFLPEVAAPEATMTQLCEAFGAWSVADMLTRPLFWQRYQRVLLVRGNGCIVTYAAKDYLTQLPPDITVEVLSCSLP
jgi:hypothetical protein